MRLDDGKKGLFGEKQGAGKGVFTDSDGLTRFWDNESEMIARLYKQLLEEQKKK